jgi:hypothetical protein
VVDYLGASAVFEMDFACWVDLEVSVLRSRNVRNSIVGEPYHHVFPFVSVTSLLPENMEWIHLKVVCVYDSTPTVVAHMAAVCVTMAES